MNPRKLLLVGVAIVLSGWIGFWLGEQKLKVSYANWRPAVILNKQGPASSGASPVDFTLFWTVWDKVSTLYVDKNALDSKKMLDGAISGMVAAIGDPYTVYLPKTQNTESKQDLGGSFDGVGIELGFRDNRMAVTTPLDGMPAARAGVKPGDFILHIKDVKAGTDRDTDGLTLPEAVKLIRGEKGTVVTLTIARDGVDKPWTVDLARDTIVVKSVTVEYPASGSGKIAFIKLSRFGDRTKDEWNGIVDQISNKGNDVTGVVLDLRNNPGGYLEMAVYIAGEFVKPGNLVVSQLYGDGTKIENKVDRNGRFLKIPTVVLVNKGSASASEILAGALQDYNRARIVGELSFGKGSVQQPEDLPDGSGVHVTVAKWLRPSGDWIDKKGIKPDVEVKLPDNVTDESGDTQLQKALQLLK